MIANMVRVVWDFFVFCFLSYQQGFCSRLLHPARSWSFRGTKGHEISGNGSSLADIALGGAQLGCPSGRPSGTGHQVRSTGAKRDTQGSCLGR